MFVHVHTVHVHIVSHQLSSDQLIAVADFATQSKKNPITVFDPEFFCAVISPKNVSGFSALAGESTYSQGIGKGGWEVIKFAQWIVSTE